MRHLISMVILTVAAAFAGLPAASAQNQTQGPQTPPNNSKKSSASAGASERGKKLVLKDGSFQLAREYQRNGERVRYFSAERGDWEELPAAMIDWDATAKAESAAAKEEEALLKTAHHREEEQRTEMPTDVDASLPVAPGIYLPPGEGMFVVEGKSVTPLDQVGANINADKKQVLKKILSPIPIIPDKRNIQIPGAKAVRRINFDRPEFYLREMAFDPAEPSAVQRSSRPGESGPEIELVRLKVKGGKRELESIQTLFGENISENRNSVMIQRWDIAKDVYRFTLGQDLDPGEYAFAEILPGGVNLYVWDFGVDQKSTVASQKKK
jgi:hypothetical protein